MAVVLGLLVAAAFGSGDFLGGRATRQAPLLTVLLVAQLCALVGAVVVVAVSADRVVGHDLWFGAAAGAANIVGLAFLYEGLGRGRMIVVAPIAAVVASVLPIAWGLAQGESPGVRVLVGVACAVVAAGLVGLGKDRREGGVRLEWIALAVAAGGGLGASLILFADTSARSGLWPVLSARAVAAVLVGLGYAVLRARGRMRFPTGREGAAAVGAGVLDVTATTLLLVALRHGLTVVVAPLASLAPAFTVLWARLLLGEETTPGQAAGIGLALVGLALIATG